MGKSPMLELLREDDWGDIQSWFDRLKGWAHYPLLLKALEELKHEALFVSNMHGLGHIERTILQGAFCAMEEGLDEADIRLLLEACSYHDVGRINDWVDDLHGHRSAQKIGALTGRTGEELKLLQGAVDAHSRRETVLIDSVQVYHPENLERGIALAQLLKDADGLDRVRLGDLDPRYLRRASSRERAGMSLQIFLRYQLQIGREPRPFFSEEEIAAFRSMKDKPVTPTGKPE